MKDGFENALRLAGCSLAEAVQRVAVNPLHVLPATLPEAYTFYRWEAEVQRLTIMATLSGGRALYLSPALPRDYRDQA